MIKDIIYYTNFTCSTVPIQITQYWISHEIVSKVAVGPTASRVTTDQPHPYKREKATMNIYLFVDLSNHPDRHRYYVSSLG